MTTYKRFYPGGPSPGDLVIKFYDSGGQVRGFVRTVATKGEVDMNFPGEEMEPHAAFTIADSHRGEGAIWIELTEDVAWQREWGELSP
jgi:hypothetical protein